MIQINILAHNIDRIEFISKSLDFLKKIKEHNKNKIKVLILFSDSSESWDSISKNLNYNNIKTDKVYIPHGVNNYLNKIDLAIKTEAQYSCSMDDDILISNYLWDFIIENISVLDKEEILFLSPLISNGIPSTDIFIEDFCDVHEKNEIKKLFQNTKIDNYWGVDYSSLNKERFDWDLTFYDDVKKINHYYKGIHPVRISFEIQEKIANIICNNKERFLDEKCFYINEYNFPYFCNSFFFIRTENWKKIINDKSLYVDNYDEVPLNLYMQINNLKMAFIRNGFCLHMAYNTIGNNNQKIIEKHFIENFIKKI